MNSLIRDFDPYRKLWEIAMDFDLDKSEYYSGVFLKLNYTVIEKRINQYYMREVNKLLKIFNDSEDEIATSICKELKQDVEKFREKMWIIELLTTEAMIKKLSHWKDIWKECELNEIEPNDEMTLQVLIEAKLQNFREIIEEISKRAEKQYGIEKKLNEIVEKMKEIKLEMIPFKNSGTFVLRSLEET